MGQIVDKAASLCQSNELGPTRSISTERERDTPSCGNYMLAIFRLFFLHITLGQIINICLVKLVYADVIC